MNRPTGTVTFLFTDIEGSTRLWERYHGHMEDAHRRHEALIRAAIAAHGGYTYKMVGDAFQAAFQTAPGALAAAVDAQRALVAEDWGALGALRVRMALHTGSTEERGDDYVGPLLNRVARLMAAGRGGQILITATTAELVRDSLPLGVTLRDLGERRLKDLIRPEHVWQVMAEGLPAEFPPLQTLDSRPNNLPRQTTALIGREPEVAAVVALLRRSDVALVTLTGPGGTGKTRLALQATADLLDEYADGVWFVDLAPLRDPGLVPSAIATVLGVKEAGGRPLLDSLRSYLRDKQLLLVLDNFEQILDAAPMVTDLLAAASRLKVLVTSREALDLYGEYGYPVPPLRLPDPQRLSSLDELTRSEAVRLFSERAQARDPAFAVTSATAPAVVEICRRLDGLPLAIELAAARTNQLTVEEIQAQLEHRLGLLVGGPRDRTARQQSLRGAIAWSYDLLSAGAQRLFQRMSVFRGGCTLHALAAVCNLEEDLPFAIRAEVESLVAHTLVQRGVGSTGRPRFGMLETIREYAAEQLAASGEMERLRDRHLAYFIKLNQAAQGSLGQLELALALHEVEQGLRLHNQRLEDDHDNLQTAFGWAIQQGFFPPHRPSSTA
jgi:predicted ATPase/class 3 adenylate cyclase